MPIFHLPAGLTQVAHFSVPKVQTWGNTKNDAAYKETIRACSRLLPQDGHGYKWFVFCIRCVVGSSRGRVAYQIPDVENIPKLIVDAFTGLLYNDDNIHHVRGVQAEASFGSDSEEIAEVWIFGMPKDISAIGKGE